MSAVPALLSFPAGNPALNIARLQSALEAMPEHVEFEKRHFFAQGVYARELTIPKGVCLVGRMHTQSQINIISKGDISVLTGAEVVRIKAPFTLVTPPGVKRAGFAHEETVWTTILGTEETDPERIYELLTLNGPTENELLENIGGSDGL